MILPFKSSSFLTGESHGTPTPRNGAGAGAFADREHRCAFGDESHLGTGAVADIDGARSQRLHHFAAAAEVDDLEVEPVLFEDAELVADIDGNDARPKSALALPTVKAVSAKAGADAAAARTSASGDNCGPRAAPKRWHMKVPPLLARFMRRARRNLSDPAVFVAHL